MKIVNLFIILFASLLTGYNQKTTNAPNPYNLVNPFIGTGGHGHTYPGATLPFGMVQLSPDTRLEGWDGCSCYHNTDSIIYGFSHTHLSGTGVADYGDILFMPIGKNVVFDNGYKKGVQYGYASVFKKSSEIASPGFYQVHLDKHDIDVRLTTTKRVGIHEYTYPDKGIANIIIDLEHRDQLIDCDVDLVDGHTIEGYRISKAWAQEQHIYFVAKFSNKIDGFGMKTKKVPFHDEKNSKKRNTKLSLEFDLEENQKIMVKVGISAVSIEGARKNLETEAKHWDFEKYKEEARQEWIKALNKIEIKGGNNDQQSIFYTALYHSMIAPNLFSDVDGKYRGTDLKIHQSDDGPVYTVFSLWDTFRATHPLFTIIEQNKTNEFIRTFLKQYKDGGQLPVWELAANYTGCMIGYHSVSVIADAYIKGIQEYDEELALEAMLHSANKDHLGLDAYKSKGFIAMTDEAESVSKNLEYAYDDWCIATMAGKLGKTEIQKEFTKRAQYYKNLFDPETGFMRARINGGWNSNFNPTEVNLNFTEANSWQYSMFVPQDISGLVNLHGGNDHFEKKLDELFTTDAKLSGRHQSDITGLIGQYAHGNEPSHHMAYLYNYIGKPWKTQQRVYQILTEQYQNAPDGLSGNEDCGQMSSWYVMSAMGIYAVTPGMDYYAIGTPLFDKAKINLEDGNEFTIIAKNISPENIYIQKTKLNGKNYNKCYLKHEDIIKGGKLVFEMGPQPNKHWGNELPVSFIQENLILPVPFMSTPQRTFENSLTIEISCAERDCDIYYRVNHASFKKYNGPIKITNTSVIEAYSKKGELRSNTIKAEYKKIKKDKKIELLTKYDNQYTGGGDHALIDYIRGNDDYRTGNCWQGYWGNNMIAVIDLGKEKPINSVALGCLQNIKSWIWYPKEVIVSVSSDNKTFEYIGTIKNEFSDRKYGAFIQDLNMKFNNIKARYVKLEAVNYGKCPEWHLGAGGDAWIFVDEIIIN